MKRAMAIPLLVVAIVFVLALLNMQHLYAAWWKAEGAIVWPIGCNSDACAVRGTLSYVPFGGGEFEVAGSDGSVAKFGARSFNLIKYPAPTK